MKLTFNEIVEKFEQSENSSIQCFVYEDFSSDFVEAVGPTTVVDKGGGEEKGSDWYRVLHFIDHDIYICIDGSYEGVDFSCGNGLVEVFPTEVTKIEYLPKQS